MKRLSKEKRKEMEEFLVKGTRQKSKGYIILVMDEDGKKKRIKRSRAYFQLIYGLELEMYEVIHHIDENKENDDIRNLELIDTEVFNYHTSKHHAGKRR